MFIFETRQSPSSQCLCGERVQTCEPDFPHSAFAKHGLGRINSIQEASTTKHPSAANKLPIRVLTRTSSKMFSPDAQAQPRPNASIRNPRRRRRHDSNDLRQPRKRSKISDETYVLSNDSGNVTIDNGNLNGEEDNSTSLLGFLPVREKRVVSSTTRHQKVDGSTLLVSCILSACGTQPTNGANYRAKQTHTLSINCRHCQSV
jgi:hypothetical protein